MSFPTQITVSPVSGSRQLSLFIKLPRKLYDALPGYVAPLDMEERDMLSPKKAPFYDHGFACYFLAWRDGKPIGRISAQIDSLVLKQPGPRTGFFGALDTAEPACVPLLLEAATQWLETRGVERIRGPWTLNSNGQSGVMIEGQNEMPMIGTPWHPATLGPAIEEAGFAKAMDLLSYRMETGPQAERANQIPPNLRQRLGKITMRGLRLKHITEDATILREIYNDAWANTWGNVPLTSHEVESLLKALKPILRPEQYVLAEVEGEPAAIALVIPNMFDISGDLGGAPSPLGWLKLGSRILRHNFHSARVVLLGVRQKYMGTALRAMLPVLIIDELMRRGHVLPYRTIELGWVLETHTGLRNLIERIAPTPYKRHRMYEKILVQPDA
ncbi:MULTISPECIES: hypothetical protein [Acetobacter]|jgi:hypothetical protein|uniref:N-acetyltransferase domain-containing protein n=1 Tax=Acetobacter lovaniensis TaxID=104100 RepID=A0A841QJJ8_9PROT|nr:hypothetical protein [Acetobacter lovaniensis]MBB6458303.1 hypothetical protein [Acetobacter lovaniensis]MCI1698889.1 hypothetical protein [Acetobacter lovaniensis]MCI1795184.1 hypothetical protein [Acetobacter lovaniensis]MCP1240526.1 hypothetical protein [Acetobacter lovaniensis]NHN82537.1 hypothetical protein [Acetobacter lovaniensis]